MNNIYIDLYKLSFAFFLPIKKIDIDFFLKKKEEKEKKWKNKDIQQCSKHMSWQEVEEIDLRYMI